VRSTVSEFLDRIDCDPTFDPDNVLICYMQNDGEIISHGYVAAVDGPANASFMLQRTQLDVLVGGE